MYVCVCVCVCVTVYTSSILINIKYFNKRVFNHLYLILFYYMINI